MGTVLSPISVHRTAGTGRQLPELPDELAEHRLAATHESRGDQGRLGRSPPQNSTPPEIAKAHEPWNKGKLIVQKAPPKPKDILAIRVRLQIERRAKDLALFNQRFDSKLSGF